MRAHLLVFVLVATSVFGLQENAPMGAALANQPVRSQAVRILESDDDHDGHDHDADDDGHDHDEDDGHDHGGHDGHDHGGSTAKTKPWGPAIGAAILVCLCTLLGIVFLAPAVASRSQANPVLFSVVLNSFAAGVLVSAAFYLLLIEASLFIKTAGLGESGTAAVWGTLILTGFIAAFTLDVIVSFIMPGPTPRAADVEKATADGKIVAEPLDSSKRIRVLIGVLIGDFMHNLCDGIFIGAAFNACNSTVGWSVAAATIYHEIAQELGDFLVLTDREQGGLSAAKALLANFLSGLSVLLGVIIVLAQDKMDNLAVGCLLAFGGGVYLQVGTVECMPKALNAATTPKMKLVVLVCFIVGAAAIGLVLIDHGHCVEDDSHAGHDHLR